MLEELTRLYDAYVDTYRDADGELPVMMRLKRVHTGFVVKNAEAIARGEGFTDEEREVALAAALLAVQILGTADADLRKKFHDHKEELKKKVAAANDRIHQM